MFHANAQYYCFASAISAGASVALMHTFSATGYLEQAARHQATHASLFAAPMRMILARGATPVDDIGLVHCWYAQNVTEDQYEELAALMRCRPRQLYGMTETIPAVLTNPPTRPIADAMGIPTLGCEVDVHEQDASRAVPDGEVGEIVVRGVRGITLFDGYMDDPETTQNAFRDGWFRTGDLARRDKDGYLYFDGRRSDVLKVAGENVSVVEVEAVLSAHPAVLEAAVVGRPDPIRDEVPVGYVVQQPGKDAIDVEDLNEWCAERLAKSKRPASIEVVDELPRTSVGKIRKFILKAEASREAADR
jgi:crotonobetaine/carnitine-CoA ligase